MQQNQRTHHEISVNTRTGRPSCRPWEGRLPVKIAPRRNHARRPFPWHLVSIGLALVAVAELAVIIELLRYIAIGS